MPTRDIIEGQPALLTHEASLRAMDYLQTGAVRSSDEIVAAFESVDATA